MVVCCNSFQTCALSVSQSRPVFRRQPCRSVSPAFMAVSVALVWVLRGHPLLGLEVPRFRAPRFGEHVPCSFAVEGRPVLRLQRRRLPAPCLTFLCVLYPFNFHRFLAGMFPAPARGRVLRERKFGWCL